MTTQISIFDRIFRSICGGSANGNDSIPAIIHDLQSMKQAKSINQREAEKLAIRINRIFTESVHDEGLSNQNRTQLYSLANLLLISDPTSMEIWPHLSNTVHYFANSLFPYFAPPLVPADKPLNYPCASEFQEGETQVIRFSDGHQFTTTYTGETNFVFHFETSDHKALRVPGPTNKNIDACVREHTATLPFGIEQFYDIDSLQGRIQSYARLKYLAVQALPLYHHQLFLMKQTYLNRQLAALGIPLTCPIDIGKKGEWILEEPVERKSLHDYFTQTSNQRAFEEQLAYILLLERTFGIYILGDSSTDLSSSASCLLEMHGETLQCAAPKKRIEWMHKPFENRMDQILQHLHALFPKQENCFNNVRKLIEKAPERFNTPEDLYSYFCICKAASSSKTGTFDSLYHWCKQLILNIPANDRPNPLQKGSDFTSVVEQDIILRKWISKHALKELQKRIENKPDTPIMTHCQNIITEITEQLDDDTDLANEDLGGCKSIGHYFYAIFWQHFLEKCESLFPKNEDSPILYRLLTIKNSDDSVQAKQDALENFLFQLLRHSETRRTSQIAQSALSI